MSKDVWDFLLPMLEDRIAKGEASYGTRLRTENGRDALWDLWEELADAVAYLTQLLMERAEKEC